MPERTIVQGWAFLLTTRDVGYALIVNKSRLSVPNVESWAILKGLLILLQTLENAQIHGVSSFIVSHVCQPTLLIVHFTHARHVVNMIVRNGQILFVVSGVLPYGILIA